MLEFCPSGNITSLFHIWVESGLNQCFYDFFLYLILGFVVAFFSIIKICIFKSHHVPVSVPSSSKKLTFLQTCIHAALSVLPLFHLAARSQISGKVFASDITHFVIEFLTWLNVLYFVQQEKKYHVPPVINKRHGFHLHFTWTAFLLHSLLSLVSVQSKNWFWNLETPLDYVDLSFWIVVTTLKLGGVIFGHIAPGLHKHGFENLVEEGTSSQRRPGRQQSSGGSPWSDLAWKIKQMVPYLWPKTSKALQLNVILCVLILVAGRVVNVYVPIYNKLVVDSLTYPENSQNGTSYMEEPHSFLYQFNGMTSSMTGLTFRWDLILIYIGLKSLQATTGSGFLSILRNMLWLKVQQYTSKGIQVKMFDHLHHLSIRWHLNRKTGEILTVMSRGTGSIENLVNYLLFSILPTLADISIAIIYFTTAFNVWFGMIVFVDMFLYLACTVGITEWRTKFRRRMNLADNEVKAKSVDSLINFETVKYYGASKHEVDRLSRVIDEYQVSEWSSNLSLYLLNGLQNVVINVGFLGGSLLCAWYVVDGTSGLRVGDYVLFSAYMMQLYQPLNYIGTLYRVIQQSFIDMENMFDLLREAPDVVDLPHAKPISVREGTIVFENVHFGYRSDAEIVKGVSFRLEAGQTLAVVGPSGAGKSTLIRLIFRFYDPTEGRILIDDQDIKTIQQDSLRQKIGVVPQDTVLFNDTIEYNVRYGNPMGTISQVHDACASAELHDKIINTFPDKYATIVGERGLKLSGGEKQRVAIARTLLKDPAIVLLDEATSSLDTRTERQIQTALNRVCSNRTTVIVAHRLSTIVHADKILVLQDGVISQQGTHSDLLEKGGLYAELWREQSEGNHSLSPEPPGTDE